LRSASGRFRISELRVKDLAITRRVVALYRKDAYLAPVAQRFIAILKAKAGEIAGNRRQA
jgi:hypothetical protein